MDNSILVYGLSSEQIEQVMWAAGQNNLDEVWETDIAADIVATNYFAAVINFAVLNHSEKAMVFDFYTQIETPLTKNQREEILGESDGEEILTLIEIVENIKSPLIIALNLTDEEKNLSPHCFLCIEAWYKDRNDICQDFMNHFNVISS